VNMMSTSWRWNKRTRPIRETDPDSRNHPMEHDQGPEHFRKEDHQGVNSVLVVEGIPLADRNADGFNFARVLEEHNGRCHGPAR